MGKPVKTARKCIAVTLLILVFATSFFGCIGSPPIERQGSSTAAVKEHLYKITKTDLEKFKSSLRPIDSGADLNYHLGLFFQKRNKHLQAIEEFDKAIQLNPLYIEAYNAQGISYDHLGEYEAAQSKYAIALEIDPNLAHVQNNMGYSYLLQGKVDEAIEFFERALFIKNDQVYSNNLGLAYARNGQFDAAYAEFRKSGDATIANYNIAQLYYQNGFFKKAKEHYAKANNSEPKTETVFKASANLDEIPIKKTEPSGKGSKTTVSTPLVEIIYNDNEGVYTIPAESPENVVSEESKGREKTDEILASIPVVEVMKNDDEGVYIIPADALIKSGSTEAKGKVLEETANDFRDKENGKKIVTAALLQTDIREEKGLVIFNESYAPQMMQLKKKCETKKNRPAPRIKIEVKNGNGVYRMANRVGNFLRNEDFTLMYLSNADHFSHEWSKIYFISGYIREAYQLAQKLPGSQTLEEVSSIKGGNAEISILIGADLIAYDTLFKNG
jgi:Flp pilus assembly protein TadD